MGKRKSKGGKKQNNEKAEERLTLEALDAMSDSDDEDTPDGQLNAKAKNLRQAIADGKFDHLVESLKNQEDDDEEIEEASLHSSSDDDDEEGEPETQNASKNEVEGDAPGEEVDDQEEEEGENNDGQDDEDQDEEKEEVDSEEDEEESEDEEDAKTRKMKANNQNNSRALAVVTSELVAAHAGLPWAETFDIIPSTPLPFGERKKDSGDEVVDIHDDLKREVAFYNSALEAVHEARQRCKKDSIPFSRPEDFFAEMVKTDGKIPGISIQKFFICKYSFTLFSFLYLIDHMAKVKDKLIFETKKMDAVAHRKSNREQKLRAKESQSNKVAEKAKRKRDHFQQVEEWANSAASNRGGALQDDADEMYLNRKPSQKRQIADKKFGFGGKRGRFKQNDRATLNDTSSFNPRGNFPGGMKRTAKSKGGSGGNRQGKRARDANRSRQS